MGAVQPGPAGPGQDLLPRDHLAAAIRATPGGGVCVVCAPAGFGARTLVAQALGPVPRWTPDSGAGLLETASEARLRGEGWLHVEGLDRDRHPEALADLERLLHDAPASQRLCVTTRTDLGRALAESRLGGRLVEVDQSDLQLTVEQAAAMLRRSVARDDPRVLDELVRLCGGWVAAVRMTARRGTTHTEEDTAAWLRTRGSELLLGAWLDDCDPGTREMLLGTAFLDVLHPDLVDAVLPGQGAGPALLAVARDPGPVRPARRPNRHGRLGYERHPLLTELLRHQALAHPASADRYARAAAWHHEHGDLSGELSYLFAAGMNSEAELRLYAHEEELLSTGHADTALRWYETATADSPPHDLTHLLRTGWAAALSGDSPTARSALGRLGTAVSAHREGTTAPTAAYASLEGEVEMLSCWLAHQEGDIGLVGASARRASELFGADLSRNSHQLAHLYLARALTLTGRLEEAEGVLRPLRSQTFALGAVSEGARAEIEAELAWDQGEVHQSRAWSARRIRWAGSVLDRSVPGHRPPVAHWLAESEAGRTMPALRGLTALAADARDGVPHIVTDQVVALLGLAHVQRRLGRHREALASAATARGVVEEHSPHGGLLDTIARSEARTRLLAGDTVRAERLLRGRPGTPEVLLLRARLGLLRGSTTSRHLLREIETPTPRLTVEHAVLTAWAQRDHARHLAELDLLRAAEVSAAHGLTTGLVGVPPDLVDFARRTAQHFVDDGLRLLVEVAEQVEPGPSATPSQAPAGTVALSRGELQLAALLPGRLSNAELAETLGVSVNTVKTRLRRLFAKLGVHDRRQAVIRVEELGLAPAGATPTDGGR